MSSCCTMLMNARAGRFRRTPGVDEMRKMLHYLDLDIEVVGTESEAHMIAVLREHVDKKSRRVAVAGGDGTVGTAIQVLAGTDTALGVVPQGTANNFATALHIPHDLASSLRVLQEGETRQIDLGRAYNRYFTESAGVGLFADALSIYGAKANKNLFRSVYAIFRLVANLRAARVSLTLDGKKIEEPAVFAVAANAFRIAHALPIAPGASLTDNRLDVVMFGNLARGELLPYYRAIRQQIHPVMPKTQMFQAQEIVIEARRRMPVHVDDRVRGTTPVVITSVPKTLRVIVDRL